MRKKHKGIIICLVFIIVAGGFFYIYRYKSNVNDRVTSIAEANVNGMNQIEIISDSSLKKIEDGLSIIRFEGNDYFDRFLKQGGASTDAQVLSFLMDNALSDISGLDFIGNIFGCSTIQTKNQKQEILFGRNFDWENSEALIVEAHPQNAYASISTVNLDFIQSGTSVSLDMLPDEALAIAVMYAPLDGMNEKGLAVSVNMIQDSDTIEQNSSLNDITTTTAIRMLLNQASDVDEAIDLLKAYDMHASMNMMIHFAIADVQGNHVVVEYINHEMHVIETPVVTNFYLTQGDKYGIGTSQSHERYDILMNFLKENEYMEMDDVKDALDRVSKHNFNEFESTEWSIVFNLSSKEIHYYHREDYQKRYVLHLNES